MCGLLLGSLARPLLLVYALEVLLAQHEAVGKILLAHHLVLGQFLGRALEEDAPLEEQVCTVGDTERVLNVVVGYQDAYVAVLQAPYNVLDVLDGDGVYAGERLVEHYELGVDGQAPGYLGASAFATREAVADVLAHLLETELAYQALQFLQLLLARQVGHLEHGEYVVLNAQLAEDARLLRQVAYARACALVYGEVCNVLVVKVDVACVGHDEARRHVERRGLARSVGAQQAHDFALPHVDRHVVYHCALAVALHKRLRTQHHFPAAGRLHIVG